MIKEESKIKDEEVRILIKLLTLTELYETDEDARNYIKTISTKLEN